MKRWPPSEYDRLAALLEARGYGVGCFWDEEELTVWPQWIGKPPHIAGEAVDKIGCPSG